MHYSEQTHNHVHAPPLLTLNTSFSHSTPHFHTNVDCFVVMSCVFVSRIAAEEQAMYEELQDSQLLPNLQNRKKKNKDGVTRKQKNPCRVTVSPQGVEIWSGRSAQVQIILSLCIRVRVRGWVM